MILRPLRCLVAVALAAAGLTLVVGPATAAGAAYCSGSGVNVLVDSGALGAGVVKGCGQGTVAHPVFDSAGYTLTEIHTGGMSGFVCTVRIGGKDWPSDGHCTGANGDGYWALFVASPGKPWVYASLGADSQSVSNGQTVAFAWQAPGGGTRKPSVAPATPAARPSVRTQAAVPHRPSAPIAKPAGPPAAASPTHAATTLAKPTTSAKPTAHPTASATEAPSTWSMTAPATVSTAKPGSSGGGLPWWIPVGIGVLLVLGAAGTWWRKRVGGQ
ncbi:MAG: hypothetical protein ACTHOG_07145 [Marmoricola sp.]